MRLRRRHPRTKCRLACELHIGGRRHHGIVVEASQSGLFVQTEAAIQPLTELEVQIAPAGETPAVRLRAIVARRHVVPAQLANLVRRGIALEILEAPVEYGFVFGKEPLAAPIRLTRG